VVSLRIYTEGLGEYRFVDELLVPHLARVNVHVQAAWMGHAEGKPSGGIRNWNGPKGAQGELFRALQQSSRTHVLFVTTMVDYYALPRDWPNRDTTSSLPKAQRSPKVEDGMLEAMRACLGDDWRVERFLPYVSLHEFEALVLSKPDALLAEFPGSEKALADLKKDIKSETPEDIDDDPHSAPSKRIERFLPEYGARKGAATVNALRQIDIEHLRAACPHFGQWLFRLESLGAK